VSGWRSGARAAAPAKTKSRSRSWPSGCREPRADRHDARGGEIPVRNLAVAAVFEEIADRLAIQGPNVFRINAYRNAARMLQELCGDVAAMAEQGRDLTELRGIDADCAGKICEIAKTGGCELLERLRREMPSAVTVLLRIPGLGPKRVAALWHDLDLLLTARKTGEAIARFTGFAEVEEVLSRGGTCASRCRPDRSARSERSAAKRARLLGAVPADHALEVSAECASHEFVADPRATARGFLIHPGTGGLPLAGKVCALERMDRHSLRGTRFRRVRTCEAIGRARKARQEVPGRGAKRSHIG